MGYYKCSAVIKMRRDVLQSKREDYDVEGPAGMTVYRLEKGKHKGTEKTFRSLTRSMGLEESLGQGILKTSEMEHLNALNEIMWSIRDGQMQSAEELMEKLRNQIDVNVPRNKQYIVAKYAELQYRKGLITEQEYEEKIREALSCTVLSFETKGTEGWPFHDEELVLLILLNNRLKLQKKYEEQKTLAEHILHILEQGYLNSELRNRYYVLAMLALADALGSMGEHREALRLDREAIAICKEKQELRSIEYIYYDIHWNYWQIKKQETLTDAEESEAYQCLLQAYYVSKAKGKSKDLYKRKLMEHYPQNLVSG